VSERRLWILIAVVALAIIVMLSVRRRWTPIDPHAAQEIEKAKQR
jgi:hypothetical protein